MTSSSEAPSKKTPPAAEVRTLGKYELQRQLGAGGMGTVYLAKDLQLKRLVALKILPHDKAKNPTLVRRFMSEAQASAQLRHEHIVAVYENGEVDGHLFIAMEFVDGTDLHELIRKRGKIPIKRSLEIIKQVAQALQHASEHNIVHRDIKPSNLLIRNDGLVKLTDLGLARSVDDTLETDITRAGTTVGTVDYMSPEQGRNSKLADIRSDLYSLGCTWYHMLTGKTPFPEGSMTNKLQAHAVKSPPNPRDVNEQVTEAMVAVLHRLMAKKPEDRYQTPAELLKDLARPSMTRGGAAEEVLSAITEEGTADVTESQRLKRQTPPGAMPPKKAAKKDEAESSGYDWETIRPLAFGAVILIFIIGLGILFAGLGGGLNLGGGPLAMPEDNQRPQDDGSSVRQTPQVQGKAAPNQAAPVTMPNTNVVGAPDGANPADPSQPTPTNMDPAGGTKTVASPTSTNPANPQTGSPTTPTSLASTSRTFDADAIPDWSSKPAGRGPNSTGTGTANNTTPAGTNKTGPNPTGTNPPGTNSKSPATPVGTTAPKGMPTSQFAAFTVGPGSPSKSHFRDLASALKALPRDGAAITLHGPGPFMLPEISLRQIQRIVLQGADGPRPILLVRPAEGQPTAGLTLAEGILELDGLDFVLDRSAFAGSDPVRMAASIDGQLMVRNTTFSVWGAGTVPVRALQVDSQLEPKGLAPPLDPRVLLERVFVRGDDVTALAISRPNADVVIRDSLFVGGAQPLLSISGTLPPALASAVSQRPRRAIRLIGTTLVGRQPAIFATADDADIPPSTAILMQDSVCAAASPAALFLDASAWPAAEPDAPGGKLANLSFTLKNALILGYSQLANLGPDSAFQAREPADWQTLWKRDVDVTQFAATAWPANLPGDLSTVSATAFPADSLPAGAAVGCDVKLLPELSASSRRWLAALSARPMWPAQSTFASPSQVVKFDVGKQSDFGAFLQQGNWPAGTVIEVSGSGLRPMTPVKLVGKSWKIVGQPQDGAGLFFKPKAVTTNLPALIVVEGGEVELVNLRFQIQSEKTTLKSLIAGQGARLTLQNVTLQGMWNDTDAIETLLTWSGDGTVSNGGNGPAWLVCRDCLFTNGGGVVRLDLGTEPVFFGNSLLASRGHALQLRLGALPSGTSAGPLVADHLTISAVQGAIHVQSSAPPAAGQAPHRLFVDRCVFAPPQPLRGDEKAAAVLRLADPASDLARVEWWGTGNGVAPEVASFLRGDSEPPAASAEIGLQRWQSTWTAEQETRLLTGAGGVVLVKPEPGSAKSGPVKPAQFTLSPSSKAKTWGDDGSAIGANISQLDTAAPVTKPKDAGKTPVPKKSALPNTF